MMARTFDTGLADTIARLPAPPEHWSYSTLREVELCPRRYILGHASYPGLWDGFGYPQAPNPAALFGEIVHDSLDRVIRALVKAGCKSSISEAGVAVLKELGGYTTVAEEAIARRLRQLDGNPRVGEERRERLGQQLEERIPEARMAVQGYLQRMILVPRAPSESGGSRILPERVPLVTGSHPEAELRADSLRVKGRVDLLTVTERQVDIVDHKTGTVEPAHLDQLRFYAMLWDQDEIANASRTPLGTLIISYPTTELSIAAPDATELETLAETTRHRVVRADGEIGAPIPVAVPGEYCGFCPVRSICDRYWRGGTPNPADLPDGEWFDFEGVIVQEHGPKSWWLLDADHGHTRLLLRATSPQALAVGQGLRLLGIRREVDPEDEAVVALLTTDSEAFVVVGGGDY